MTLVEAFAILRAESAGDRDAAWIMLFELTQELAPLVWDKPTHADVDDVAMESMTTLVRALERDVVPHALTESKLRAYVKTTVYRTFVSLDRVARRSTGLSLDTVAAAASDEDTANPDELLERTLPILGRVIEAACEQQARAGTLRDSAEELISLARRTTDTTKLILARDPELATDSLEFRRRRDALFKRHERARARLVAAAQAMLDAEELTQEEAELALGAIQGWLKRRRTGGAR